MRIAVVQFDPKIGQVQENIAKAHKLCEPLQPGQVDLLCLPEMIFTGYVFPDAKSITPYLEDPQTGPTSRFCAELAARLRCYVVAGYPERLSPADLEAASITDDPPTPPHQTPSSRPQTQTQIHKVGANAAVLYAPSGALAGHYRKTNLYDTDMSWAVPGTPPYPPHSPDAAEFATFALPEPLGTLSLAICMDLNVRPPAVWEGLEEGPYELAAYCARKGTRVLVLLNAWLDSGKDGEEDVDWSNVNYWAMRLRPLWAKRERERARDPEGANEENGAAGEEVLVVVCNRCGEENGITFAGSSALFRLVRGAGRPELLHVMPRRKEGLAVWEYPRQ